MKTLPEKTLRSSTCLLLFCLLYTVSQAQFRVKSYAENATGSINDISFLSPSTGYVAFAVSVAFTQDSGSTYTNIPITYANTDLNGYGINLLYGFRVSGVRAFSNDSLLVFGDYGAESSILFSANHGQNWKIVYHRDITNINQYIGFSMNDMVFPGNSNIGIAVNDKDILRTTNRGQTWTVITQLPENADSRFTRLSFPTNNDGYALAGNLLYKTSNGGISWSAVALPVSGTGLVFDNISFVNPSVGYLTKKDDFTIYKTVNGASSWAKMNDETKFPITGTDMRFINDSTGLVAALATFQVYKTTDNGKSWERCQREGSFDNQFLGMKRLFFYNNNLVWASGAQYVMLLSGNAGGIPIPKACFDIDINSVSDSVLLNNCSKPGYSYQWFRNGQLIAQTYNARYKHGIYELVDTIQLVVSNGINSDTLLKYQSFNVPPYIPVISSFTPSSGTMGTAIAIYGSGFTQVNQVKLGGSPAASFTVLTDNIIMALVGNGSSGDVYVRDPHSSTTLPGFTYRVAVNAPAPVISSFSPTKGPVGTMVTITGSNFNSHAAGNIISFGAVQAPAITASATQVTCKVPPGASMEPITVYNSATGLTGSSRQAFNLTFADSAAFTPFSFALNTQISYNGANKFPAPFYSLGKDVDGDGKPDLITAVQSFPNGSLDVIRNTTASKYFGFDKTNKAVFFIQGNVSRPVMEDMDGDGKPDILMASGSGISIIRNQSSPGNMSLAAKETAAFTSVFSKDVAAGDLDGDGKNDLAIAASYNIQVVRNTSAPGFLSFGVPQDVPVGANNDLIALADLDGDGKTDVLTEQDSAIICLRNKSTVGGIAFDPFLRFAKAPGTNSGKSLHVADYDGDGKPDVIAFESTYFSVFRNTSTAGKIDFATPFVKTLADITDNGWGGVVANLSGDARPDVLTGGLQLFRNISTTGNPATEDAVYINPHYTSSMSTSDFDLDGKPDVISTSPNGGATIIYRNKVGDGIDFPECPNNGLDEIRSDVTGASYQWQQDTGTGFIDIKDGPYFKNTNTLFLGLYNLTSSFNGTRFRCKVDNQYSQVFVIAMDYTFEGWTDNHLENAGNYSCGVAPDKYCDVVITKGNVILDADLELRSLVILPGATLTIKQGRKLTVIQ